MDGDERTFNLRFSIAASIPEPLWEDDTFEDGAWLAEWEANIKPGLLRTVFEHLRSFPGWEAHVRNRGLPPTDEIEIVLTRRYDAVTRSIQ